MNTDDLDNTRQNGETHPFDPFVDRLSRDIRNHLSEAIIPCLRTMNLAPAREVANRFLQQDPGPEQREYIEKRLSRFQQFLDQAAKGPQDVLWQGFLLWDLGLHFEVHEVLEHAWHHSRGDEKSLLQAMIRAAGVYIKSDYGYNEPAAKLAAKALPVLEAQREKLSMYIDPERLYAAMRTHTSPAPLLMQ
ncbi:DUF309 domain-containing protein [Desulfobulbus rhabdoformis]|uniref:DUF309 domain-containing protein n=1 Tax=Desulfobulbus rhabdoformis TaxID=34032 RepID=UPI001965B9A8|nr:DUF309 domain-containing protein [Desulfobulbus rhabdoformis]MBM9613062.1 DUF309 domain-containing protein [Desulfobulbus rhabdoformis]